MRGKFTLNLGSAGDLATKRAARATICERWGGNMARDLGRLNIDKLIVHDIPSRRVNTSGPSPTLSEIESPLTTTVRNYIRDKVVGTLTNNSFPVVFDSSSGSPVPSLVMDNLGNQTKPFIEASQELANHLFQTQKGSNPPGLLAVAPNQT